MYLNMRPSKVVFERRLRKALAAAEPYTEVLDCACASGKNRYIFPEKIYYGVDFDAGRIEKAKQRYNGASDSFFYLDDMTDFQSDITSHSFGLVISTHTLTHIENQLKQKTVQNLTDLVKKGGSLIIQSTTDNLSVCESVADQYARVTRYRYRGSLSRMFEAFVSWLYQMPINRPDLRTGKRARLYRSTQHFMLAKSWVLSALDWIGTPDHFLIHYSGKK
jgi:SAM-dependent methyltransferase